jgi:hypothetical protein
VELLLNRRTVRGVSAASPAISFGGGDEFNFLRHLIYSFRHFFQVFATPPYIFATPAYIFGGRGGVPCWPGGSGFEPNGLCRFGVKNQRKYRGVWRKYRGVWLKHKGCGKNLKKVAKTVNLVAKKNVSSIY